MPRKPSGEYRTALGSFVEAWRRERGLTQGELQKALPGQFGDRYVSKVESGQIRRPRKDFLHALATLTRTTVEELNQKALEPAVGTAPTRSTATRVVLGHSLWGVPAVLAAQRGLLSDFLVASIRPLDFGDESDEAWIKLDSKTSSVALLNQDPTRHPLSAADVLGALEREDAEIGIVPGDVVKRYSDLLLPVGVIFDGSAGMVWLSPEDEDPAASATRIPTRELGPKLVKRLSQGPVAVALDEATVAREVFRDIERAGLAERSGTIGLVELEACRWHVSTAELARKDWSDLKDEPGQELFGLITWEPLATWICNRSPGAGLWRRQLLAQRGPAEWPRHFTFEVVIRKKDAHDRALTNKLERLMSQLWQVTAGPLASQDALDGDTLERIAHYFGLDDSHGDPSGTGNVARLLSTHRYVTYWYEGTRSMLTGR